MDGLLEAVQSHPKLLTVPRQVPQPLANTAYHRP